MIWRVAWFKVVHRVNEAMIYLSANGTVLGQFEESAVPQFMAERKITAEAFYWRQGMDEWRPVSELIKPAKPETEAKPILPKLVPAPIAARPSAASPQDVAPKPAAAPQASGAKPAVDPVAAVKSAAAKPASSAARGTAASATKKILPPATPAAGAAAPKKTIIPRRNVVPGVDASAKLIKPEQVPGEKGAKTPPSGPVVAGAETGAAEAPRPAAEKSFTPRRPPAAAPKSPPSEAGEQRPMVATGGGRTSRLVWLLVLLLLVAAAGGGAWWWLNRAPAAIPGSVSLSGDEGGPVQIRVFRREELTGPWRERLAAADARAAELERLVAEARAQHRQRVDLYDEAAAVCAVGEEYNMPDVEELRADRDAKKAEADAAKAELDKLQAEKETLFSLEALLAAVPAPWQTIAADLQGNFSLPPPPAEGGVVLLATVSADPEGQRGSRAWLEALEISSEGAWPEAVQLSGDDLLDVDKIRSLAGAAP